MQWSPFWRWLAVGVLAAMTIAWVAQSEASGREARFAPGHAGRWMQEGPWMMGNGHACFASQGSAVMPGPAGVARQRACVNVPESTVSANGTGSAAMSGSTVTGNPALSAALQRQRTQLQRQEAALQQQQAQLSAQMAATQARLNSLAQ